MKILLNVLSALLLFSCTTGDEEKHIYNGRLESDIIRISAQSAGLVDTVAAEEGQIVRKGQLLAKINSQKLKLRLEQQMLQQQEISYTKQNLLARVKELNAQLSLAQSTLKKTGKMVMAGAATNQKRDELAAQVSVLKAKKEALDAQMKTVATKQEQTKKAIDLIRLSIDDTHILSPADGRILNQFICRGELAMPGKALFEIADISRMEAIIYLPLQELSRIKLGQKADITVDGQKKKIRARVSWISSTSEFTPKTILTKETRTTLVYQVKLALPNPDGLLKIGMPVDVTF